MLLDRFAPTLTATHHTIEGTLSKMSEAELLEEIARVTKSLPKPEEDAE